MAIHLPKKDEKDLVIQKYNIKNTLPVKGFLSLVGKKRSDGI